MKKILILFLIGFALLINITGCERKQTGAEPVNADQAAEVTEPEKDKPLDLVSLENLKWIMDALVTLGRGYDDLGFDYDLTYVHGLYSGEENAIITMLWYMNCCGIDNLNAESFGISDEYGVTDAYVRFSVEQVQEVMNSLTGQQIDISSVGENGAVEFSPIGTVEIYSECKNWNTEYLGNNTWKVYADVYSTFGVEPLYKIAEVAFTVTENDESIFDGYSIIEVDAASPNMTEWAKAYYDYLVEGDLARDFYYEAENYSLCLCYIDEDNIPELYVNAGVLSGYALYTYYNGEIVRLFESIGSNYIEWVERSGRVLYGQELSAMYAESVWIYEMANGELQQIAEGTLITQDYADWYEGNLPPSTWNGQEVTEEEYRVRLNEVFDISKLSHDNNDLLDLYSILDMLTYYQKK